MEKINLNFENKNQRLDVFLSAFLNLSRKVVAQAIENGLIFVNGVQKKSSYKIKGDEIIEYDPEMFKEKEVAIEPQDIKLDIKYEDDYLIVLNKPKNMLTHPSAYETKNTLVNALLYHCGDNLSNKNEPFRRGIVHRLDKNTAGLMLAAKTDEAARSLQEQIRTKSAIRKYLAIALGDFEQDSGVIDKPLKHYMSDTVKMQVSDTDGAKEAITYYKVLEKFQGAALVELELKTGRTHQIRAHLSSINHPVFGDSLYGAKGCTIEKYRGIKTNEQVLESYYLRFTHPVNNEIMTFELEPKDWDADLVKVLKIMRGQK